MMADVPDVSDVSKVSDDDQQQRRPTTTTKKATKTIENALPGVSCTDLFQHLTYFYQKLLHSNV